MFSDLKEQRKTMEDIKAKGIQIKSTTRWMDKVICMRWSSLKLQGKGINSGQSQWLKKLDGNFMNITKNHGFLSEILIKKDPHLDKC